MESKKIQFNGIIRSTSPQNNADGNCEEIINMRQENGVWRTVGKKKVQSDNCDYTDVFIHEFDGLELAWGKKMTGENDYEYRRFDIATGQPLQGQTGIHTTQDGYLTGAQNFLISMGKHKEIFLYNFEKKKYDRIDQLPVPQFEYSKQGNDNTGGSIFEFTLTNIRHSFLYTGTYFDYTDEPRIDDHANLMLEWSGMTFRDNEMKDMMGTLIGSFREVIGRKEGFTNGYVFLCATYELFDGSEVNYTPPMLIELGEGFRRNLFRCTEQDYNNQGGMEPDDAQRASIELNFVTNGIGVENLKIKPRSDFSTYKNIVKRMNVYMTPVIDKYDTEKADGRYLYFVYEGKKYNLLHTSEIKDALPKLEMTDKVIKELQFYRILQFNPGENREKEVSFKDIATNKTMPVDGKGWFEKSGKMYLYNQRIHMYDYINTYQMPDVNFGQLWGSMGGETSESYTYIKTGVEDVIVRHQCSGVFLPDGSINWDLRFTFSDARAYKIVHRGHGIYGYYETVMNLVPSNTHNFAFSKSWVPTAISDTPFPEILEKTAYANKDSLIVYEANNPLCHAPFNSYRMDGYIRHVGVSAEQISGSQIGQFPLYIFTDRGIYAMQVGSGTVLYSSVIPVSAEVATGQEILQTKYGIIFPAISGLKIIAGQQITDLSEPVDGAPDLDIRHCPSYSTISNHEKLCQVDKYLSVVPFREYAGGAAMGYDISRDELLVSNVDYNYSYVLGLKTRMWHKITEVFTRFCRHIALKKVPIITEATAATARLQLIGNSIEGESVGIMINGNRYYYTIRREDDVNAVAKGLAGAIAGVRATASWREILLEAEPGKKGNDISLQVIPPAHMAVMVAQPFSGGSDKTTFIAVNVCDLREEEKAELPVLLQTRPICLETYGFKTIYHTLLRGELNPVAGERYFGVYLFGSDDLINWHALSQFQFNYHRPHVVLERARQSFRYFVLIACGDVQSEHRIAMAEFEGGEKYENRLR